MGSCTPAAGTGHFVDNPTGIDLGVPYLSRLGVRGSGYRCRERCSSHECCSLHPYRRPHRSRRVRRRRTGRDLRLPRRRRDRYPYGHRRGHHLQPVAHRTRHRSRLRRQHHCQRQRLQLLAGRLREPVRGGRGPRATTSPHRVSAVRTSPAPPAPRTGSPAWAAASPTPRPSARAAPSASRYTSRPTSAAAMSAATPSSAPS